MSPEEAIGELRKCSGTQFDPKVVEKFIGIVSEDKEHAMQVPETAIRR
jgi:HD-GYP domain-containing protein (c-di-GMP phosphodiesterase class II)